MDNGSPIRYADYKVTEQGLIDQARGNLVFAKPPPYSELSDDEKSVVRKVHDSWVKAEKEARRPGSH